MRNLYYDRKGNPITFEEWGDSFGDFEKKVVAKETLPNGYWVSTVWIGLDHRFDGEGAPLIFETMVFSSTGGGEGVDDWGEKDMERYSTEEEAIAGHAAMVEKWKAL